MLSQSDLIGKHPSSANKFGEWLLCEDVAVTSTKRHRSLKGSIPTSDNDLIDWLAKKLINHHFDSYRLNKLKEKYSKLGFKKYAEEHRQLPIADKTRKGNCTEIILTEYIESCLEKNLTKAFKLRYNPNVDQAIKGDDVLLLDMITSSGGKKARIYLGEAKFRSKPVKAVVLDIIEAMDKDKKPLSLTYMVNEIAKTDMTLANAVDELIIDEIKKGGDLIYTGLLLSNTATTKLIEDNLSSDNPTFVMVSIGIDDPPSLIKLAFERAEYYVQNPHLL